MKYIVGRKIEMSQVFDEKGMVTPVTLVAVEPCTVTAVRTKEKDGYDAVQIGSGKKNTINKAEKGHLKDLGPFAVLKEYRVEGASDKKVGDIIDKTENKEIRDLIMKGQYKEASELVLESLGLKEPVLIHK